MIKTKGNLKINFSNRVDLDFVQHHNKLTQDLSLAKGESFSLSLSEINPIVAEGDFVDFPARHISATIVGANSWKATDFRNEQILKESAPLLKGVPVYLNHNLQVGQELGVVGETKFTPGYVNSSGRLIPAGIDGPLSIDKVLYPDYVRKMSGKTPSIKSVSVTVDFEWESSHEFERESDFYYHIGETINGEMVRRVVTKINGFYETSLVWLGADPYAGLLDENNEVKFINDAGVVSLSAPDMVKEMFEKENKLFVGFCFSQENKLSLNKTDDKMEKILKALALQLGKDQSDLTEELIQQYSFMKKEEVDELKLRPTKESFDALNVDLNNVKTQLTEKESSITSLNSEITQLKSEKQSLEADAKIGKDLLSKRVSYAVELYSKSTNGNPVAIIEEELKSENNIEKLEAKINMFGGKLMNEFSCKCNKCGDTDISFRSSVEDDTDSQRGQNNDNNRKIVNFIDQASTI